MTTFDALCFQTAALRTCATALLLATVSLLPSGKVIAQEDPVPSIEYVLHAPFPLGAEAFLLMPGKRNFYLFGSLENHALDGVHVFRSYGKSSVTRRGAPVRLYPDEVVFRVTATTATPEMTMDPPSELEFPQEANQLLLGLQFKLKVFRGLERRVLQPSEVRLIGIPSDQPSNERIYRVSFKTSGVPVDARLALEVSTPTGERMTRFRIELM